MNEITATPTVEHLLEHADWVRALARTLVSDPNLADDVVQEAWVDALRLPPQDDRNVRGWLARVVRNAASQVRRSEARRGTREAAVARQEALPDTASLVERAALQRELAGHVLALEEPYRRTVLLRYFEGLEATEIARREGVPAATVRTRLQRGIAQLRERLDRARGGRESWLPAVAALARAPGSREAVVAAGAVTWIASLAGCAATAALVWWSWPESRAETVATERVAVDVPAEPLEQSSSSSLLPAESAPRSPVPANPAATADPIDPLAKFPRARVRGRVVDIRGNPLAGLSVRARDPSLARRDGEWVRWKTLTGSAASTFREEELEIFREFPEALDRAMRQFGDPPGLREVLLGIDLSVVGTTAADGSFDIEAPGQDPRVESDDDAWVFACDGWVEARTVHLFVAAPAIEVGGTVVDASAAPIEGVGVEFGTAWPALDDFPLNLEGSAEGNSWHVITDADGRFRLERIPSIPGAGIRAWKQGFTTAVAAEPEHSEGGVTIVLTREAPKKRPHVRGVVLDGRGAPVAKAWVQLGQDSSSADEKGAFDLELTMGPRDGTPLTAVLQGRQAAVIERFDEELAGRPEGIDGVVLRLGDEPLTITGIVLDAEGRPCAAWKVDLDDGTPLGTYGGTNVEAATLGRMNDRETPTTDAQGKFELGGLLDRTYRVRVRNPASCLVILGEPVAAGARDVEIRVPADALRAVVRGRVVSSRGLPVPGAEVAVAYVVNLTPGGGYSSTRCAPIFTDAAGGFELRDVPRRNVFLSVASSMVDSARFDLPPEASGDDVRIEVEVLCRFKLEARPDDTVDDLQVLDADGKTLRLQLHGPRTTSYTDHARRDEDGFPAVTVSERAASIVLRQGNRELRRVPVDLRPGELQVIVP